jgi:glucokinase
MLAAMDVGGTHIRCHIFDAKRDFVGSECMSTRSIGLIEAIEMIANKYALKEIGISYAGQVNDGIILSAPNIEVDEANIQKYFLQKHHIKLSIENDLKCAALAEYRHGNCHSTMLAASIGTGFGSATIEKNKLLRGAHNLAGEIGHIPYKYSEIPCGCGNHYCIEAFCSGAALSRWIKYYKLPITEPTIQNLRNLNNDEADLIVKNFQDALLFAIGSAISLINPEIIVLGGGVVHKNPYLLEMLKENVHKYSLPISGKQTKIIISELENAPLIGAGMLIGLEEQPLF